MFRSLGAFLPHRLIPNAAIRIIPLLVPRFRPSMQPSRSRSVPPSTDTYEQQMHLNNMAVTYIQEDSKAALLLAEKIILQGLKLNEKHFALNYNLGCVYSHSDLDKSLVSFKEAYKIQPNHPLAKNNYLITLHKLVFRAKKAEDYQLAHQYLDELMPHDEYVDYARLEKSRLYKKEGNLAASKHWECIALELNPFLSSLTKPEL